MTERESALNGGRPVKQLEQDGPQRIDVRRGPDRMFARDLFGRHIAGRSGPSMLDGQRVLVTQKSRQAEISDLRIGRKQNILRFEIAVNNTARAHVRTALLGASAGDDATSHLRDFGESQQCFPQAFRELPIRALDTERISPIVHAAP
ncbi:MAG: hypothetical protein V9H26_10820 [Verrucomicrobiota bacterium]